MSKRGAPLQGARGSASPAHDCTTEVEFWPEAEAPQAALEPALALLSRPDYPKRMRFRYLR